MIRERVNAGLARARAEGQKSESFEQAASAILRGDFCTGEACHHVGKAPWRKFMNIYADKDDMHC